MRAVEPPVAPMEPPPSRRPCRAWLRGVAKPQVVLSLVLLAVALNMQGCFNKAFKTHSLANWRAKQNYLITYAFDGGNKGMILNSCSVEQEPGKAQCSGRGVCENAYPENMANAIFFCRCDPEWADPECSTPRKSHRIAFALSCFLGWAGVDLFYLEFPIWGFLKMITLGGGGVWWLVDIVRVGSARVYAGKFRVSDDLPHAMFAFLASVFTLLLGFMLSVCVIAHHVTHKRRKQDLDSLRQWRGDRAQKVV